MYVEIGLKQGSYTPEAFAYQEYLRTHGHSVHLCQEDEMSMSADIRIYFMGFRPCWEHGLNEQGVVVHEYQSLSIPPFHLIKDVVKRKFNSIPSGRIFLNKYVRDHLSFESRVPYICRDMGVSRNLYGTASENPDYDLLYCGTLEGRGGLVLELIRLARLGLKILVVGSISDKMRRNLSKYKSISLVGRVSRDYLPQVFSRARAGLNYTPDIFPFNIQTSTKTLEYCASGMGLVSNDYAWVRQFSIKYGFKPLWLSNIRNRNDFDSFVFDRPDLYHLEWNRVLSSSGFDSFLLNLARNA